VSYKLIVNKTTKYTQTKDDEPNKNWYENDEWYVVDETTEEGKILADKIIQHAPYFDFVLNDAGNLIDITLFEKPFIPPTEEEINNKVRNKIAEQYDYAQEIQMLNKALSNANDTEYLTYKEYRQSCIEWGIAKKQKYGYI
jgi:hypothetical protein